MGKVRPGACVIGVVIALFGGALASSAGAVAETPRGSSAPLLAPAAMGDPSTFVPVTPARIADTRTGVGGVQGPIANDATVDFQVVGVAGVPAEATSVVLNVTAVDAETMGYFTVFAAGGTRPDASNLNVVAGKNVANLVIAGVGTGGKVSLYNFGGHAHVILDVTGYFVNGTGAGRFFGTVPLRDLDTRVPDSGGVKHTPAPNQIIPVPINVQSPEVVNYSAVLVNVTVTGPRADGYLSVFPAGEPVPASSNLNFKAGQTVANAVIVKVGKLSNGWTAINVFNALAATDVIVDLMGLFDDGTTPPNFTVPSSFRALDQPVRIYNTRTTDGPFGAHESRIVNVAGAGGAPAGALGVIFNATATATTAGSYLTIWALFLAQPTVSSLNWAAQETVPNFVGTFIASNGATAGRLAIYNDAGSADVLIDVAGYFYPV